MHEDDADFAKAARLMREAVDKLYEASEILGVYDTGDASHEGTLADIAYYVEQDIPYFEGLVERMEEI